MEIKRTVTREAKNGKIVKIQITRKQEVKEVISYADGWNIPLGKKTVDTITFEVYVDGTFATRSNYKPQILTESDSKRTGGAYARLGDLYLTKDAYEDIMTAVAEIETEMTTTTEFEEVKAQEEAKEAKGMEAEEKEADRYAEQLKNGFCPKCGSYCYGDCSA